MGEQTAEPVAVVLTVLNEAGTLGPLLDDLLAQRYPAAEIIVVDGGSTDGTLDILRRYAAREGQASCPPIRTVSLPGANISQGRNRGIAEATSDLLAITDAGVRIGPGWLELITAPLRAGRADLVAGFFAPDPRTPFETALGATVLPALEDIDPAAFLPSSRSVAFRRETWRRAGGYPEWLDYCEDLIFDIKARRAGVRVVFEPRALVHFRPRQTPAAFFRQYYRYARGDGKAGLWSRRHALRYLTYAHLAVTAACLVSPRARRHRGVVRYFTVSTMAGGLAYIWRPVRRLLKLGRGAGPAQWACMLALVPVLRLIGDAAKMAGYPVGCWWRARHRPPDWRRP